MTVVKLIGLLQVLADKGHGGDKVQLLCCDDNPINGDGVDIKGVYAITGHPDKGVDGVYIDGTYD